MKNAVAYFGHKVDPGRDDVVYLCLDRCIRLDGARDMLITLDLRNADDVDEAVSELRKQLEIAGKSAKAALKERSGRRKGKH